MRPQKLFPLIVLYHAMGLIVGVLVAMSCAYLAELRAARFSNVKSSSPASGLVRAALPYRDARPSISPAGLTVDYPRCPSRGSM